MKKIKKLTIEQKLAKHFVVKTDKYSPSGAFILKVNADTREVKLIANTYFYIDSDFDMLIPGCCAKTISDKGPESNATAKIKHQSDHNLNTQNVVGRFTVLDERKVEGYDVLYCESFIPDTRKGNDDLTNYKEGLYDNHSIGFMYRNLIWAEKNSENELSKKAWEEYHPLALNPEKADEIGGFYVVKEIELFEISVVSFGANSLTPNLSGKSKEDINKLKTEIIERIENISSQLKSVSDKTVSKTTDIEVLQLKQIIADLELYEPFKKSTEKPGNKDTDKEKSFFNKVKY